MSFSSLKLTTKFTTKKKEKNNNNKKNNRECKITSTFKPRNVLQLFKKKEKEKKKRFQNPKNYCSKPLSTAFSSFTICSTNHSRGGEEA
jgi:hypothetical protein